MLHAVKEVELLSEEEAVLGAVRKVESCPEVVQEIGTVVAAGEGEWTVMSGGGHHQARRAVSCLVTPEAEDEVLLALVGDRRAFILAVLERREGSAIRLEADGDVALRLRKGRFSVAAQEGIDLATAKEASVVAGALRVNTSDASVRFDRLGYLGRFVQAEVERVKLVAGSLDTVLDRLWQRVKRSYRYVEEVDHVRADQLDYAAKKNAHIRGRNTLVTAEELVKVDAEQIHLG